MANEADVVEGFTMPPLTVDSERNAMYKQIQRRPTRILPVAGEELSQEKLVLKAFALFSSPTKGSAGMDNSVAATTAFTRADLKVCVPHRVTTWLWCDLPFIEYLVVELDYGKMSATDLSSFDIAL